MRARILRPDEWQRLDGEGLASLLPFVEPQNIDVVVVENSVGDIAAHVSALRVTHFEGLSISPRYHGNAGVFRALIRKAYSVPRSRCERWVFGGAEDTDGQMDSVCRRLGGHPLPLRFYPLPVGES